MLLAQRCRHKQGGVKPPNAQLLNTLPPPNKPSNPALHPAAQLPQPHLAASMAAYCRLAADSGKDWWGSPRRTLSMASLSVARSIVSLPSASVRPLRTCRRWEHEFSVSTGKVEAHSCGAGPQSSGVTPRCAPPRSNPSPPLALSRPAPCPAKTQRNASQQPSHRQDGALVEQVGQLSAAEADGQLRNGAQHGIVIRAVNWLVLGMHLHEGPEVCEGIEVVRRSKVVRKPAAGAWRSGFRWKVRSVQDQSRAAVPGCLIAGKLWNAALYRVRAGPWALGQVGLRQSA